MSKDDVYRRLAAYNRHIAEKRDLLEELKEKVLSNQITRVRWRFCASAIALSA
jgi:hypothetical protein